MRAIVVDNFAGGGGASLGIEQAIGRPVDYAINHDPYAIAIHRANHPATRHYCEDIYEVNPREVADGREVALAWFSPDCKHFSKAKGGRPVDKKIRGLAWVVIDWARLVRPRVIMLENVEEFRTWGPLDAGGYPIAERKGETFQRWTRGLQALGYRVEFRELRGCDYGAPTIRKRLFMVARRDGLPIVWPEHTHGPNLTPFRTAAECIDWALDCPSIFERSRPLVENTMRRIANGIRRYVLDAEEPFIVRTGHYSNLTGEGASFRGQGTRQPLSTVTTRNDYNLVTPYVVGVGGRAGQSPPTSLTAPLGTITAKNDRALVAPSIIRMNHAGAGSPSDPVTEPLRTVTTQHNKHQLVAAFLARHFGGMTAREISSPLPTTTVRGSQNQLVTSHLMKYRGTSRDGQAVDAPMPTVTAGGNHIAEVRAFLLKYYGTATGQSVRDPMHTVTSKERLGLVTVAGADYQIVDIGMRMLTPRELARAQGFPDGYRLDPEVGGKPLTKTRQVAAVGNSVCPDVARELVAANVGALGQQTLWAGHEVGEAAGG